MFILPCWTLEVIKVSIVIVSKKLRANNCLLCCYHNLKKKKIYFLKEKLDPLHKISGLVFKMCNIIFSNAIISGMIMQVQNRKIKHP